MNDGYVCCCFFEYLFVFEYVCEFVFVGFCVLFLVVFVKFDFVVFDCCECFVKFVLFI